MRRKHVKRKRNGRKCEIDLDQVERKGKLGWQDLFEAQRVKENGQRHCSHIEQEHSVDEVPLLVGHLVQKDEKVYVESEKVFGP